MPDRMAAAAADEALAALAAATRPHEDAPGDGQHEPLAPTLFRGASEPTFLSAEEVEGFAERGYCVVRGAFLPGDLADVEKDLDRFEASNERRMAEADAKSHQEMMNAPRAAERGEKVDDGRKEHYQRYNINVSKEITFTSGAVLTSDACRAFVRHPVFQGITRDIIAGRPRLYNDQAVYKKAAPARNFPLHQDNGYAYIEPQLYLTCWVALTDADEQSGCP
eukprot:COSAG06_NODE_21609_length_751_cov_0.953988_1_plen_222_part_00